MGTGYAPLRFGTGYDYRDKRDAGFSTCSDARSFATAYGKGSALAGRDAGIGGDATRAGGAASPAFRSVYVPTGGSAFTKQPSPLRAMYCDIDLNLFPGKQVLGQHFGQRNK
ncbi:hypothetical protein QYF36_013217 [Acer negundo]|nr:hypothetical protein QYF36_013217 [Acer negundo]